MPEWVCEGPRRQDFCCPTVLFAAYYRAPGQTSAAWPWQRGTSWRVFEYRNFQTASLNSIQTPIFPHYPHYRKGCVGLEYVDSGLGWVTTSPSLLFREAFEDTAGWQVFQRRCRSMREETILITFPLRHQLPSWCISYHTHCQYFCRNSTDLRGGIDSCGFLRPARKPCHTFAAGHALSLFLKSVYVDGYEYPGIKSVSLVINKVTQGYQTDGSGYLEYC